MLLIHDLVEIDSGDTIVYNRTAETLEAEKKAANRIFSLLPHDQKKEFMDLWLEFEKRETHEAKFAAALDRMEPVLQNIFHKCDTWNSNSVSSEQVMNVNSKIADGSTVLWSYIKSQIADCVDQGLFKM